MAALHVGDEDLPFALHGRDFLAASVRDERGIVLRELEGLEPWRDELLGFGPARGDLAFLRSSARNAYRAAASMARITAAPPPVAYPDQAFARKLRLVAQLVSGGFDTRVFFLTLGGFDTHARQAATHAALLGQLSQGLGAFQSDLEARGVAERVVTLVYSEFGRRAAENGSRGTDHGAGAPVFLLGARVRGGMHGRPPDLERLVDGDVAFTTDFRALYSALEHGWLGCAPSTGVAALDLFA